MSCCCDNVCRERALGWEPKGAPPAACSSQVQDWMVSEGAFVGEPPSSSPAPRDLQFQVCPLGKWLGQQLTIPISPKMLNGREEEE